MKPLLKSVFRFQSDEASKPDDTEAATSKSLEVQKVERTVERDQETEQTLDLIEDDLRRVAKTFNDAGAKLKRESNVVQESLEQSRSSSSLLKDKVDTSVTRIEELGHSTNVVADVSRTVTERLQEALAQAQSAVTAAGEAHHGVTELQDAIASIGSVVTMIGDIAKQTNLLALNATIEAARAGEAGRGFAVVANEVKALSSETQKATEQITQNLAGLEMTASTSIGAVDQIVHRINEIEPMFQSVAEAINEQKVSISEIESKSAAIADDISDVRHCAEEMDEAITRSVSSSEIMSETTTSLDVQASQLGPRLVMLLRQTILGDRRGDDRLAASIDGTLTARSQSRSAKSLDISSGGLLIQKLDGLHVASGDRVEFDSPTTGKLKLLVRHVSEQGYHCALDEASGHDHERFQAHVQHVRENSQVMVERSQTVAKKVSEAMAGLVQSGRLSLDDLFDTDYRPIPDTSPQQYTTRGLEALEQVIPPITEPALAGAANAVFCLAIDINGYIGVHNKIYSHEQRPGETVWNTANCRNKRIFDDRAGLSAARNTRPFLIQTYPRDMGGGKIVWMMEVDAPVYVHGRHWGGIRFAYKL